MIRADWSSFRDFVEMEINGTPDATMRAYDLVAYGVKPTTWRPAVIALGYNGNDNHIIVNIYDIRAKLVNEGVLTWKQSYSYEIAHALVQWFNWYRIKHGYIRRWPLKSGTRGQKETPPVGDGVSGG